MDNCYDVIVVGAGPSGLCAAKTWVEAEPAALKICLIDTNASLGGVWAKEKLFPGLKTNNLRGTMDFTDMPMDDSYGVAPGAHVPGHVYHNYLLAYARKWDLVKQIKFNTMVTMVQRDDESGDGWIVQVRPTTNESSEEGQESQYRTRKLVITTGVTNTPHQPSMLGKSDFDGPIIHSSAMGLNHERLSGDANINTIAVIGGGKSAYDAVYLAAKAGKDVHWIMRESGKGPAWVFPAYTNLGPFKAWREKLITRRIFSFLSPCIWGAVDGFGWIRDFLHMSTLGKIIARNFWSHIHHSTLDDCGYAKEEKLHMLEPEQSPFWYGTGSGVFSYTDDFYALIRSGQVQLYRSDISHLSPHTMHLASGKALHADAIITATGYSVRPTIDFQPPTLAGDLGIPTPSSSLTKSQSSLWRPLELVADAKISQAYPQLTSALLKTPPTKSVSDNTEQSYTPYRLYHSIAPPLLTTQSRHSIAFVGYVSNIANTTRLEIQCLWAYAYLTNQLPIDTSTVFEETALMSRFCRWRAPYGHGRWYPDLNFDQLPFFDLLLKDLGLNRWRKGDIFRELFAPYGCEDYRGLVQEWLGLQRRRPLAQAERALIESEKA